MSSVNIFTNMAAPLRYFSTLNFIRMNDPSGWRHSIIFNLIRHSPHPYRLHLLDRQSVTDDSDPRASWGLIEAVSKKRLYFVLFSPFVSSGHSLFVSVPAPAAHFI